MRSPIKARVTLLVAIAALSTGLACTSTLTAPDPDGRVQPPASIRRDEAADTLDCKSGFVVIAGRATCN